ncbi:MAG: hypothetical protein E7635_07690 [Ruminococcaceae bacterium]|nr:hypothetical protein [Oscillospiraceae bacterium]
MPNREDGLSRDERDAISAELLLKKLRDGLEMRPGADEKEPKKQAVHISDEAIKLAQSEIIRVEPEEFGGDDLDEDKLREIMEMPATEEKSDKFDVYVENEPKDEPGAVTESKSEENFDESDFGDTIVIEADEDVIHQSTIDDLPWYEDEEPESVDEDTAILDALAETDRDILDEEKTAKEDVADEEFDSGFLAQMAKMIEEDGEFEPIELLGEDSDTDETIFGENDIFDEPGVDSYESGLISDDGAREYSGLNGNELNSTEISLISLFGKDDELEETFGKERAEELIKEGNEFEMTHRPKKKKLYELFSKDYEYTDEKQNDEIKGRYKKAFVSATIRFFACFVFAVALFFMENATVVGIKPPNLFNVALYPTVAAMTNLQLVLLCALMIIDKIALGFVSLFKRKPAFESIPAILLVMSVVYTTIITVAPGTRGAVFYNFPVALTFLFTLVYELLNLKREANSFGIVSAVQRKYTVRMLTEEERTQDAGLFEGYVPENSPMFAVTKTGFVDGFFRRINFRRNNKYIPAIILIAFAEMLVAAALGIFMKADVYTTVTMAYLAGVLGLPGTILIAGSHPFYHAVNKVHQSEGTIVGDGSLEEYSDGSVVFFDDRDIFPSTGVKINSVKVYGENRIDGVIYYAASVFAKIGGPLADVFGLATLEIGHSDNVMIEESEDNGLRCSIDGTDIYLGNNAYMISKDFETPYGEGDEVIENNEGIRLMFIANEEEILAKFYVQYTVDSEYEEIFKQLYKAGMCVGIRTCDPNIDDGFVIRKLRLGEGYPVRVVHGKSGKRFLRKSERADSGVVCIGSVKSLLRSLSLCDKIKYIAKIHSIFEIVSTVLAIFVIYAIAALGKLVIGSAYAALYQLFWLIPIMFVTLFTE